MSQTNYKEFEEMDSNPSSVEKVDHSLGKKIIDLLKNKEKNRHEKPVTHLNTKTIAKLKESKGTEELKEKDIKAINKQFILGHIPRYRKQLVESDSSDDEAEEEEEKEIDFIKSEFPADEKLNFTKKVLILGLKMLYKLQTVGFSYASKAGRSWILSLFPANQIYTLALFFIYTYVLNANFLVVFIPLTVFFLSFAALVISTLRILRGQRRFKEFLDWSDLLISVDGLSEVKKAEANYFKNHISPVVTLLPAVFMLVMSLEASPLSFIPEAPLALVSMFFFATGAFSLHTSKDRLYLVCLVCIVLSSVAQVIPHTYVAIPGVEAVAVGVSISGALTIAALACFAKIPFQKQYRCATTGFMKVSVPLIVITVWWKLSIVFLNKSNYIGILKTAGFAFVFLVSAPISVVLLILETARLVFSFKSVYLLATATLFAVSFLYFRLSKRKFNFYDKMRQLSVGPSLRIIIFIILGFVGLFIFTSFKPTGLQVIESKLKEQEYVNACLKERPLKEKLEMQEACHQLNGHHIKNWTGKVSDITISTIENKVESVANVLPNTFATWLSCTYGDKYPDCKEPSAATNSVLCKMAKLSQRPCTLQKFNTYKFLVTVTLPNAQDQNLMLSAHHSFYETILNMKLNDEIVFSGELNHDTQLVKLGNIKTAENAQDNQMEVKPTSLAQNSLQALFNFVLYPLLVMV